MHGQLEYSAGILDLKKMVIRTRKVHTMNGICHPQANVDSSYSERKEGGRGLLSIE